MTEKDKYLLALSAEAALNSEIGSKLFTEKLSFDILYSISRLTSELSTRYDLLSVNSNKELYDYLSLSQALPTTSFEAIKITNDKITEIYKNIQSVNLYDPRRFFDIYFSLNGTGQDFPIKSLFNRNYPNFNTWFAESKVVDDIDKPIEVYHGAGGDEFTKFNFDRFPIAYFAEKLDYSEWFKNIKGGKGTLFSCYLRIQNPIDLRLFKVKKITYDEFVGYIKLKYGYELPLNKMLKSASDKKEGLWAWQYLRGGVEWLNTIKKDGYFDGFAFYENNPDQIVNGKENVTPAWAVFYPEQIKSVNNLTFSYESKDIRFKEGGKIIS